jgi:hypothetical protein
MSMPLTISRAVQPIERGVTLTKTARALDPQALRRKSGLVGAQT